MNLQSTNPHVGSEPKVRVNLGCGASPTPGWSNYDGSPSVKLAKRPLSTSVLRMFGLLRTRNLEYINFIKNENIKYANVTKRLPFADNSCDVVYSSHMLEHINPADVPNFLSETHRVLKPNGIVRIAVPDLMRKAKDYLASGDADEFMRDTLLGEFWSQATSFRERLRFAIVGDPSAHKWMYDGMSLVKLLKQYNFTSCNVMPDGETQIADPGELDLYERSPESVFVEGRK